MATITKSPKLEQLSLYYRDSRNVDFSGILGPEVVTRITECKIWNITSFVRLCADPAFRPRLIFDISDTIGRSSLEDEAKDMLAAIAGLPSVESLDLGRLTSRCIVERGLPPNLCELKLDELLLNARTVANGVARITELLQSRPQLTIKIRRFSHWESTSPAEIAEGESWDRAIVRSGKRAR
ncbi:hypothetical protein DFJ74DRAFT_654290 [Hyaloraphidium curvatum]|nr:hypothetical protein DFJ74DRAFT_654290 [Hyaloraphidium curvatum]